MQSKTTYAPVEIREPVPQPAARPSVARILRALFIEHRLPYRLQQTLEHILHFIGLTTKIVKIDGPPSLSGQTAFLGRSILASCHRA